MNACDYFERIILNLARGISATAPEHMYLALYFSDPGDSGTGTELSYAGYERPIISFSAPADFGGGKAISNVGALTFAQASASLGTCGFVGVLDSPTGGNMYVRGPLTEPLDIVSGIAPVVRAGAVKWISTGKLSNAYKIKVMNLMRGVNAPGFTPYLALCNGSPESGGAEFSGNGYARTQMAFSAPANQNNGAMLMANTSHISTPTALGTWGTMSKVAIYDAVAGGEPYIIDDASIQATVTIGRAIQYEAGAFSMAVN